MGLNPRRGVAGVEQFKGVLVRSEWRAGRAKWRDASELISVLHYSQHGSLSPELQIGMYT